MGPAALAAQGGPRAVSYCRKPPGYAARCAQGWLIADSLPADIFKWVQNAFEGGAKHADLKCWMAASHAPPLPMGALRGTVRLVAQAAKR